MNVLTSTEMYPQTRYEYEIEEKEIQPKKINLGLLLISIPFVLSLLRNL